MAKEINKKKVNKTTRNNKNKDEIVVKNIDKKVLKENEEKDKKRRLIIIVLLLLLLCIFGISVTFGKDVFGNISDQILEVLDLNKPTAPVITGGSEEWAKERLIKIEKDAKVKDTLSYYEYCIREEKSTKKCEWNQTETKNVKVVTTGKYYVTFRAVDNEGRVGKNSNTEVVYIDNNNPVIKNIKREITNNSIKIEVEAKDEHSGIKSYSYSLGGKTYSEGKSSYTFNKLDSNKEYTIYIKVEDKVGNITTLSMVVKTDDNKNNDNQDSEKEENKCTLNCDTNNNGKCDLNCDTDGDGKIDTNIDTNGDGKCDKNCTDEEIKIENKCTLNCDFNGDGKCDLNCDTDGDGKADTNIDIDEDGKCELNCDNNQDGKCDLNCDTNGDGKADTNIDTDEDGKCDLNCDTDKDGECDVNCDTDSDGKCDLNCDTNNNGKCDLNCDTDSDGECDVNCDTDGDNECDLNCSNDEEDLVIPQINLNKVPAVFLYGSDFDLPSYYEFGTSGGEVECKVGKDKYEDTTTLGIGNHVIECVARGNNGISVRVSKRVEVKVAEGVEEGWDGWIRLNLYYPDNSTNWEWRIGKEGEIRTGYDNTDWQAYTGPILVRLEDVDDVYIRYTINGETYVIAPNGKVAVDINPNKYTLNNGEKTKVEIYYDRNAVTKEYRIGNGNWQEYTEPFEVGVNTLIEARATKEEKVYDSEGNYVYTSKRTGTDSVFISEYVASGSSSGGTTSGGSSGSISYVTTTRVDGSTTTAPSAGSTPSTYLAGPTITSNPSREIVESVKVTVAPQEEAEKIYVSIGGNSYQEYTDSIDVRNNTLVRAYYIRKIDGKVSETSRYYIQNIKVGNKPYVRIDATPDNYLTNAQDSVKVSISGSNYDTLEYSLDGVIYSKYTSSIEVTESSTVYARGINKYGTTVERLTIPTITPSTPKGNLNINIYANPTSSSRLINKTEVTIIYDSKAEKKYYRLAGEENYKEYTGPFEIRENTTIYAYATGENASGSANLGIDFLTTGIMEPIITVKPSKQSAYMATVSITFDRNASKKYYQINGGERLYYTGPFEIYENSEIYAYNSNTLGYEAESSYEISNIIDLPRYLVIDKGKYFIIRLNYPEESNVREYKWKPNGTWKNYEEQGILLIKPEYKEEFDLDGYEGIKVEDDNGKEVIFTDHYYLIDIPFSELMENLFMRWDTAKPKAPEVFISQLDQPVKELEVGIVYPSSLVTKYYKIVTEDGTDSGWIEYTGPFKVTENNVVIYAKGETFNEVESEVSSIRITNIDKVSPEITVKGDFETPKQQVTVTVNAIDNMMMGMVMYASGEQTLDYFKENGTTIPNNGTFTITENGTYTIYAKDQVGNEVIKVIEVTNIDKNAPDIIINVLTERFGPEAEINIDYGDSVTREYKIGEKGSYKEYTENLIISSYDVYDLANEDGSLTIYARGKDEAGNIQEVSEKVYILDLDVPESPKIIPSEGYPTLTKDGMIEETESYVVYDTSRDDLMNYYRIDEGEWTLYTGPIIIKKGKIEAKSVKVGSGLTVISNAEVIVPSDAVAQETYDVDNETYEILSANTTKKFTLLSNLMGRKVRFYIGNTPASNATITIYDREGNKLDSIKAVTPVTTVEIPVDAYKVWVSAGSGSLQLKEISLRDESSTVDKNLVPIITIDNPKWTVEKIVNIKYPEGNYTKEYSIDDGVTWQEYTEPFVVEDNLLVIARVVKEEKVVAGSTFTITMIDPEMPVVELNVASGIQLGYDQAIPTYYKVGASGGNAECRVGDTVVANISELKIGNNKIVCTVKNNVGREATVSKNVKIVDVSEYVGDSILELLERDDIITGRYKLQVNDEIYPVHVYVYDEDQHFTQDTTFGDSKDVATADTYAQNMVIVKVNGDVTIDNGVTVGPYYTEYGGPKGFTLYVTGKLENNGTIDNSHGAKAEGQNVYLWKNTDGTFEYVSSDGALANTDGANRQTGGGGNGGGSRRGSGSAGTSYSGGTGGGGSFQYDAGSGTINGGAGGNGQMNGGDSSAMSGGGAGNPGGYGCQGGGRGLTTWGKGSDGTGGLLILYADSYINNGTVSANGSSGGSGGYGSYNYGGGGSGGGSVNIFTNQDTGIDQLGIITATRYEEIKGITSNAGGAGGAANAGYGVTGGAGTLNIGEIRNGQYYDLTQIIEQDKEAYIESVTIRGDSILSILNESDLDSGYYFFAANGESYPVHLYAFDGDQHWTENQTFGDSKDVATANDYAQNMVIVKVNGDVTIDEGVTVEPYYDSNYGGPKGFTLYVTGKLENNGKIDNSHGARAEGQDVYLWKNTDGTFEYVSANGALANTAGASRQTGGGGNGAGRYRGSGSAGTSYSGGTGGGGSYQSAAGSGEINGGAGGNGQMNGGDSSAMSGGGAGNPGGYGCQAGGYGLTTWGKGSNGTGGLLIVYADDYENNGTVSANGAAGGNGGRGYYNYGGGGSGGGSVNIFYYNSLVAGNVTANGGAGGAANEGYGVTGGKGTVNHTKITYATATSFYTYPLLSLSEFKDGYYTVKINSFSTLASVWYSLDEGKEWYEYKKPFVVEVGDIVHTKGIDKDGTETNVHIYTVPEITDNLEAAAFDNNKETTVTIAKSTNKVFTLGENTIGKDIRFFFTGTISSTATIKIYDIDDTELESINIIDTITVFKVPENAYKVVVNSGSSTLTVSEINMRQTEFSMKANNPIIELNDLNWTTSKTIDITYPSGYINEYSLDMGETWLEYLSPIIVDKPLTVLTRTVENDTVISSSSFNITKVDSVVPTITLNIPEAIALGNSYLLPTSYTVGISGGSAICKVDGEVITNTSELDNGTYLIQCSVTNGANVTVSVSKTLEVLSFIESDTFTYDYLADTPYQSFIAPSAGYYKVELWGASGGYALCNGRACGGGGAGAYTKGIIYLNENQEIYVYVGEKGSNALRGSNTPASYNGGGLGTWDHGDDEAAGAGGGATDIRLISGEWNSFDSLKSRIMVAASGGGGAWSNVSGGAGGGLNGYTNNPSARAATQTTGYAFGQGQDGWGVGDSDGVGGAGSGYYGGFASGATSERESGASGSSFISGHNGCDAIDEASTTDAITHTGQSIHYSGYRFFDTIMVDGLGYQWTNTKLAYLGQPTRDGTSTQSGNSGNGYAKITKLIVDEVIDITLDIPDRILVGSDYPLPTSVAGSTYSCKIGETEFTNTKNLSLGTHDIVCSVTSIGGKTKEVTKQVEVYDEEIDITLDIPDSILVGSSYRLPTSVTGNSHICKVGDVEVTNTSTLEVGTHDIICTVISLGGNTKEVAKQIEVKENPYIDSSTKLTIGTAVTAKDGSKWHVLEASAAGTDTVVLLSDYNLNSDGSYNTTCGININNNAYCSVMAFDSDRNTYDESDNNNVGYFIKNVYKPLLLDALPDSTNITLPTAYQIAAVDNVTFNVDAGPSDLIYFNSTWLATTNYWTKTANTAYSTNGWYVYGTQSRLMHNGRDFAGNSGVRPVITTPKSNLLKEGESNE